MRLITLCLFILAAALIAQRSEAQNATALVVGTCGSPPGGTYVAGHSGPWTIDTNGQLCLSGGSGSGNVTESDSNTAGNMIIGAGGTAIQDITSIATPALIPGVLNISGTTTPTLAAGHLTIGGTMTAPTFGANAEGAIYMTTTGGLTVQGQGSTSDFALFNKSGTSVCIIGTGSTALTCTQYAVSGGSASGNRFYLSAANTPAISANSTLSQSWTSTGTTIVGSVSAAGGLILFDGSGNMSGNSLIVSGTSGPGVAAGILYLNGIITAPTFGANGEGAEYLTAADGLVSQGQGSVRDYSVYNKSGTLAMSVPTGTTNVTAAGIVTGSSFAPTAATCASGNNWLYLSAANNLASCVNGQSMLSLTVNTVTINSNASTNGDVTVTASKNLSAGASARTVFNLGNNTASTEFQILLNSSANSGGNGVNSATIRGAATLFLQGGTTNGIELDASGLVYIPSIAADTGKNDATVCEDSTTHQLYSGTGTLGVCLGTSSIRFKHDIAELDIGLDAIMKLEPVSYKLNADHGDPNHLLYGFTAEQGGTVLPDLMGRDVNGRPNTFDYLGVVPVLVRAVQQQQAEIEALKRR